MSVSEPDSAPPPQLHRSRWRRPSHLAAALVVAALLVTGGSIGVHALQGVGSRQEAQLTAARSAARSTLAEATRAGVPTTALRRAISAATLPTWSQTAVSLLLGGGSLPERLSSEAARLTAAARSIQPALDRWQQVMASIRAVRAKARAQLTALATELPALKPAVEERESRLSLQGAVPLAREETTLATLTSADTWAGELAQTAKSAAASLQQDRQLLARAQTLALPLGSASADIQQADQQLAAAKSSAQVNSIVANLAGQLLPLQVDVRAADPGPGQVIVVRLAAQTLTAYQNGTQVLETPVTTGRPGLRTPLGIDTITWEQSPYLFISPWPPGNVYYYPPSWVTWVLHFHSGGYFIHDAPWEPNSAYGPGSENGPYSSHGCVQVPHAAMQFLWTWTKIGATVVVAP